MKLRALCFAGLITPLVTTADFYDPMKPPPYALNKFRLEKIKFNSPVDVNKGKQKTSRWVLSSILYSKQRQHAIINNKLVKKGDVIKGAKLVRLRPDGVRLIAKGRVINLSLKHRYKSNKKSLNKRKL